MTLLRRLFARLLAPHIDAALEQRAADAAAEIEAALSAEMPHVIAWFHRERDRRAARVTRPCR